MLAEYGIGIGHVLRNHGEVVGDRIVRRGRRRKSVVALFRAANLEQTRRNSPVSQTIPSSKARRAARALYVVTDRNIVKVGITNSPERRLAEHHRQGLWKVVYILRSSPRQVRQLELTWISFVRENPHLQISRESLPDGYTEALALTSEVQRFIDGLVGRKP